MAQKKAKISQSKDKTNSGGTANHNGVVMSEGTDGFGARGKRGDYWKTNAGRAKLSSSPEHRVPCDVRTTSKGQKVGYDRGNKCYRPVGDDNSWAGTDSKVERTSDAPPSLNELIDMYWKQHAQGPGLELLIPKCGFHYGDVNSLRVQISKANDKIITAVCLKNNVEKQDSAEANEAIVIRAGLKLMKGLDVKNSLRGGSHQDSTDYDDLFSFCKANHSA